MELTTEQQELFSDVFDNKKNNDIVQSDIMWNNSLIMHCTPLDDIVDYLIEHKEKTKEQAISIVTSWLKSGKAKATYGNNATNNNDEATKPITDITNNVHSRCPKLLLFLQHADIAAQEIGKVKLEAFLKLTGILDNCFTAASFRAYLEKSFCEENIFFWKEVAYFRAHTNFFQIQEGALQIWTDFLSKRASYEVNVDYGVKEDIRKALTELFNTDPDDMKNEDISLDKLNDPTFSSKLRKIRFVFDVAFAYIFSLMQTDCLPKYFGSAIYKKSAELLDNVVSKSVAGIELLKTSDWDVLFTNAEKNTVKKGHKLLIEGEVNPFLFRLVTGKFRVWEDVSGVRSPTALLENAGSIIGEMSVISDSSKATTDVVAETDATYEYIEASFVRKLLFANPAIALKFYKSISAQLAQILYEVEQQNRGMALAQSELVITSDSQLDVNKEMQDRFSLPPQETLLAEFDCEIHKSVAKKHGTMFFSPNYACFYTSQFGLKVKKKWKLRSLKDIKKKDKYFELKGSKFYFKSKQDFSAAYNLVKELHTKALQQKLSDSSSTSSSTTEQTRIRNSSTCEDIAMLARQDGVSNDMQLTMNDWEILLGGKEPLVLTCSMGDILLKQGQRRNMICQIVSGKCVVIKESNNPNEKDTTICVLTKGKVFGEISCLVDQPATATIVAVDRTVKVQIIDMRSVQTTLMQSNADVSIKFFNYLCKEISDRTVNARAHN